MGRRLLTLEVELMERRLLTLEVELMESPPTRTRPGGGAHGRPPTRTRPGGGAHGKPPTPTRPGGGAHGKPPSPTRPRHGAAHGKRCPPNHPGGGYHGKPPSQGSRGGHKAPPSRGGGGHYSPPTRPIVNPPHVPSPVTPTPTTPTIPLVPVPPSPIITPAPRVPIIDPNIHPVTGTCNFWRTHPALIWGIIGYWGTISGLFGMPITPIFGFDPTILQALGCRRKDGYGALLREGAASFLNSMANKNVPFATQQVKDTFVASLASEKMAAAQAQHFKLANKGHLTNYR